MKKLILAMLLGFGCLTVATAQSLEYSDAGAVQTSSASTTEEVVAGPVTTSTEVTGKTAWYPVADDCTPEGMDFTSYLDDPRHCRKLSEESLTEHGAKMAVVLPGPVNLQMSNSGVFQEGHFRKGEVVYTTNIERLDIPDSQDDIWLDICKAKRCGNATRRGKQHFRRRKSTATTTVKSFTKVEHETVTNTVHDTRTLVYVPPAQTTYTPIMAQSSQPTIVAAGGTQVTDIATAQICLGGSCSGGTNLYIGGPTVYGGVAYGGNQTQTGGAQTQYGGNQTLTGGDTHVGIAVATTATGTGTGGNGGNGGNGGKGGHGGHGGHNGPNKPTQPGGTDTGGDNGPNKPDQPGFQNGGNGATNIQRDGPNKDGGTYVTPVKVK